MTFDSPPFDSEPAILIRLGGPDDRTVLERLAALDSQRPIGLDTLIAEVDGVAVAALSMTNGRLVADPFVHTASVRDLLRVRAASLQARRWDAGDQSASRPGRAAARPLVA